MGWVGWGASFKGEGTEGKQEMGSDDWSEEVRESTVRWWYCPSKEPSCTRGSMSRGKERGGRYDRRGVNGVRMKREKRGRGRGMTLICGPSVPEWRGKSGG